MFDLLGPSGTLFSEMLPWPWGPIARGGVVALIIAPCTVGIAYAVAKMFPHR